MAYVLNELGKCKVRYLNRHYGIYNISEDRLSNIKASRPNALFTVSPDNAKDGKRHSIELDKACFDKEGAIDGPML